MGVRGHAPKILIEPPKPVAPLLAFGSPPSDILPALASPPDEPTMLYHGIQKDGCVSTVAFAAVFRRHNELLRVQRPNDPSSATRPTRAFDCNLDAMAGFAAAHG